METPTTPPNHNDPQFWVGCLTGILAAACDLVNVQLDPSQLGGIAAIVVGYGANKIMNRKKKNFKLTNNFSEPF